ncbi:MAG: hypothetical protein KJ601_06355 [Nanoarchaeota archaeon]|nr:hypothetical protein [Nanoarchaeota archaeon]
MNQISHQKILNKKESKEILKAIKDQWGADLKDDYVFLKNDKERVSIANRDIEKIDFERLKVNSVGVYICETQNGIRLSIEGSQLIGPLATKNVLKLEDKPARDWLKGIDIEYKGELRGFLIIQHNDDFLGCGKAVDGKILNHVPKTRRINASD